MVKRIMSTKGRATRFEFWAVHLISYLTLIAGLVIITRPSVKYPLHDLNPSLPLVIFVALLCLCIATQIFVGIRRMHDLNQGSWTYGVTLIPVVGFVIYFFTAGFIKGNNGENRYGPSPVG